MYDARNRLLDGGSLELNQVKQLAYESMNTFLKENPKLSAGDVTRYLLNHICYDLDDRFLNLKQLSKKELKKTLWSCITDAWENKMRSFSADAELMEYIRLCSLQAIDSAWVEQVDYLQQLQYLVSGRSMAQRNPVFEYHTEAYDSFLRMEKTIKQEIVRNIFLGEKEYDKTGKMRILFP